MQDSSLYSRLLALTETVELPTGSFAAEIGAVKIRLAAALTALGVGGGGVTAPVTITSAVGSSALTIAGGVQVASFPALDITQTWNNAAAVFTAIKLNVTNTASDNSSQLLNLQVGGAVKFSVDVSGKITAPTGARLGTGASHEISPVSGWLRFGGGISLGANDDSALFREAVGINAQRSTTIAQTFRIYGTFTDVSNYERTSISHVVGSGTLIAAETLGTGADNQDITLTPAGIGGVLLPVGSSTGAALRFLGAVATDGWRSVSGDWMFRRGSNDTLRIGPASVQIGAPIGLGANGAASSSDVYFGRASAAIASLGANNTYSVGVPLELVEQTAPAAPATNKARLYLQDNGSGKTQYMILFATGVAQELAIEA